ncbi:MAG: dockerin type I repeat-containing protein [Ruminococcus sp.]|nr:dockerin type I repeat-containing protein [Ruminococcus sp.]
MDTANYNFGSERVNALISELSSYYHDVTIDTYERFWSSWRGGGMGETGYNDEKNTITSFYSRRYDPAAESMKRALGLTGRRSTLTIKDTAGKGTISVNTITPELKGGTWSGQYFSDYPVTLSAKAEPGYRVTSWETNDGRAYFGESIELYITGDVTVTPVYEESGTIVGDINNDGSFNTADLVMLSSWLLGKTKTVPDWQAGDICYDNKLDSFDLTEMRRLLIGR